jgi:hypothetical protein
MSSYLKELVWTSPVLGMEEQQIFQWNRIEESSPSQVNELIPEGAGLVLPCLRKEQYSSVEQKRRILLTEPSLNS